jgi:hypothetical protein
MSTTYERHPQAIRSMANKINNLSITGKLKTSMGRGF